MYNNEDIRCASKWVRSCAIRLGLALLLFLEAYVVAAVSGKQMLMLAILLVSFVCLLLAGDLRLMPQVRYLRFLKEMERGLRRTVICLPQFLEEEEQMQDGVRVRALQVRLPDGDSRIFYVNCSKLDFLPAMDTEIELESYGRHVTGWKAVNP